MPKAYIAACFLAVCFLEDSRSTHRSRSTEEVLKITRTSIKDYKRVEKIVQDNYNEWSDQKNRERNSDLEFFSKDLLSSNQPSSKRAKAIGQASKEMHYDTTFIEKLTKTTARTARVYSKSIKLESPSVKHNRYLDSIVQALNSLPDIERWKNSVISKATSEYGSIDAAVDALEQRVNN